MSSDVDSRSAVDEAREVTAASESGAPEALTPALAVRRELRPPRRDYDYFVALRATLARGDDTVGADAPTASS